MTFVALLFTRLSTAAVDGPPVEVNNSASTVLSTTRPSCQQLSDEYGTCPGRWERMGRGNPLRARWMELHCTTFPKGHPDNPDNHIGTTPAARTLSAPPAPDFGPAVEHRARAHATLEGGPVPSMTLSRHIARGGGGPGSREQAATSRYITVIACAKCGSTSVLAWLYEALHGHAFHTTHKARDYIHHIRHWEQVPPMVAASRPDPPRGATTYLILARDPISRYTSSFRSKIQCVNESGGGACARLGVDCHDRAGVIKGFVALASRAGVKLAPQKDAHGPACLQFAQFIHGLVAVFDAGIGPDLNIHLLPQHFYAAAAGRSDLQGQHLIAAAGGVSQPGELLVTAAGLSQLTGELEALFGLRPVEVANTHRSKHNVLSAYDAKLLQLLNATRTIRSEYAWLHASDKTGRAYLV